VSETLPPLDPRLRRALRAEPPAPSEARERVRTRLAMAIPAMRRDPSGGTPQGGAGSGSLAGLGPGTIAVSAFVLGGITGAALLAALVGRPAPRVVYVDRPVLPAVAAAQPTLAAPPVEAVVTAPAEIAPAPSAHVAAAPSATAPAARPSRFAAERMLLDEARAALVQGAPDHSFELLAAHRTRFPDGLLAEERDAMEVEALVNAGRYADARTRADAFHARSPKSLFTATVDSAIASIP